MFINDCPHCNSSYIREKTVPSGQVDAYKFQIECKNCGLTSPMSNRSHIEAAELWNALTFEEQTAPRPGSTES